MADNRYKMVDTLRDCAGAVEDIMKQEVVAVDAEGVHLGKEGPLTLLQVARLDGFVYLFNIYVESRMIDEGGLKRVLESKDIIKVFHSCSGDSSALKCQFGVMLDNIFDIQAAQYVIDRAEGRRLPNFRKLGDLCALYTETSLLDDKDKVQEKWYKTDGAYWAKIVFTPEMIDYACADVRVIIPDVYESLKRKIEEKKLQREFEDMVQHQLHTGWDSTWKDKTNRMEVINSILVGLQGKYEADTPLEDIADEDDISAIKQCRPQNVKDFPVVVRNLKTKFLKKELKKKLEDATRDDDFVPMRSHHHMAATGKKYDDPEVQRLAGVLSERIDEIQEKCMEVMYHENTPVNFLADFERRFIRGLRAETFSSSNPVMRHLYEISIKADMDDIDAERQRLLQEGKSYIPPSNLGLFRFFTSARNLPEDLRNKAKDFIKELQDKGIIEAPKTKQQRQRKGKHVPNN